MMNHNNDAFATMLLMSQITPNREELSRPLSPAEWHDLRLILKDQGLSFGALLETDMSGMMLKFSMREADAYRLCVLLGRTLPLSMSLEQFALRGIDILCYEEKHYPARFRERLQTKAPPMLYLAGRPELFKQDAVAFLGNLPPRGDAEPLVRDLARMAVEAGYVVLTDGVTGVGRIAEDEAVLRGGRVIEIVADSLSARSQEPDMQRLIGQRSGACVSITHPDAPYTVPHALARNKCVYALANAAFVIAADQRRGATFAGAAEALRNRYCDFVYVWDTKLYPGNGELAARGATPFAGIAKTAFEQMAKGWRGAKAEQLSMFDRGGVWP